MQDLVIILILSLASLIAYRYLNRRKATDVLLDLVEEEKDQPFPSTNSSRTEGKLQARRDLWFLSDQERNRFLTIQLALPFLVAIGLVSIFTIFSPEPLKMVIPVFLGGLALGYLVAQRRMGIVKQTSLRQIDFFLPVIMERMVMAVQAGLDVFAAMKSVVELEKKNIHAPLDPVTKLADRACQLTEQGMRFEEALKEVSTRVESPALKHALMHLGVAHKEGGELIFPLKELADATQLYYQESLEEEIAGMPVKATLPLLMTFAGLIIFFITPPLLQVLELTKDAMPK